MAEKKYKSQAEKAAYTASKNAKQKTKASDGKNKVADVKAKSEKDKKKVAENKTKSDVSATVDAEERSLPPRLISSLVFLGLFIVFVIIFFTSEGIVTNIIAKLIKGLLGNAGYLISIPALLYLFIIHAFSGKSPVAMRTVSVTAFVLIFASVAHMFAQEHHIPQGASVFFELYNNTSGGVISGLLAILLTSLFNDPLTYVILFVGGILSLLGAVQITIPSLVRAVKNRPRADWELEEEEEEKPEPATMVVNHIANKRIAYLENQRRNAKLAEEAKARNVKKTDQERAEEIMKQIQDLSDGEYMDESDSVISAQQVSFENIPETMPELITEQAPSVADVPTEEPIVKQEKPEKPKKVKVTHKEKEAAAQQVAEEISKTDSEAKPKYCFPPIDLLKLPSGGVADGTGEMRENTRRLNETLASFKIEAHIINVTRGPSVTRYEVELEKGVRLNKLTTAADDIALSLGATGVRIAAIPGKISVVGIEVPNRAVTTVSLREVIDSPEFHKAKSKSSFAVGKDIGGNCIVGNISKLPHMLIAGTTGSGKSVCMNSIIISLLYKASPEDVKLIMVDPKMVELGIYNGIPHLLIPVVTDPKKAAGSLQWAVSEMMRRYKAMSDVGVRDLESYNSIMEGQQEPDKKMPQVVVIIDELADLMLVAAKEVEESICRIAQMGRAAGIHLVIATQRPSADVITGLMKANIPSRIAFSVASAMESRIILDTQGAEKLVGRGDMLFAPIGDGKPKRVQGCFVSDPEVEAVAVYVKSLYNTSYDQQVMEEIEKKAQQTGNKSVSNADAEPNADELDGDEMLPAAVDVILETGQASVSMLQRRLKLGYARAARIVDEMEEKGIVGPFQGSKPRDILITKEQWDAMRGQSAQMAFDDIEELEPDDNEDI